MIKRAVSLILVLILALSLSACGVAGAKKSIVGTWETTGNESNDFGSYVIFNEDGTMSYAADLGAGESTIGFDTSSFVKATYKIIDEQTIKVTVKVLFVSNSEEVPFKLSGDTLYFDGVNYDRVKD